MNPDSVDKFPDFLMIRDTGLHDDAGGLGQRIYTTAGAGYTKVRYIRADLCADETGEKLGDESGKIEDG